MQRTDVFRSVGEATDKNLGQDDAGWGLLKVRNRLCSQGVCYGEIDLSFCSIPVTLGSVLAGLRSLSPQDSLTGIWGSGIQSPLVAEKLWHREGCAQHGVCSIPECPAVISKAGQRAQAPATSHSCLAPNLFWVDIPTLNSPSG